MQYQNYFEYYFDKKILPPDRWENFLYLITYLNSPGIPKTVAEATCPSE